MSTEWPNHVISHIFSRSALQQLCFIFIHSFIHSVFIGSLLWTGHRAGSWEVKSVQGLLPLCA